MTYYYLKKLNDYAHVPQEIEYRLLGSISGLPMKVIDIHYEELHGIIFVLIGDNDLKQRVGEFITNLLGSSKKGDCCGRLICLRSKNRYTFDFSELWHIDFYSHVRFFHRYS